MSYLIYKGDILIEKMWKCALERFVRHLHYFFL